MIFNTYMLFILTKFGLNWAHVAGFIQVQAWYSSCSLFFMRLICFVEVFWVFVFLASVIFFYLCFHFVFGSNQNFWFGLWLNQRFQVNPVEKKKRTYTLFSLATFFSRVFWFKNVFGKYPLGLFWLVLLQKNKIFTK